MPRLLMAILVASAVVHAGSHAFAMGGGGGHHHSGGGSGPSSGSTTDSYYLSDRVYTAPEPGTIALLGTGAGAVGLFAWLRRKR